MARNRGSSKHPVEGAKKPARELVFSPDARRQLFQMRAFEQRRLVDAINQQLIQADPRAPTRHKFALDPGPEAADYELRVGDLRVLYRVEDEETKPRVIVAIIGRKDRNKLIVEGAEFPL
jgi:mRNA-degrading endonuclease RelE of RelBE toxin-antitoxin system